MAIEPGMIFEVVRSASDAAEKFVASMARSLALEADLLRQSAKDAQKNGVLVDIHSVKQQVKSQLETKTNKESVAEKVQSRSALFGVFAATFLAARGLAELAEFATTPSPAAAFMLTVTPPPVTIALYAVVAAVSAIKLGFELSKALATQAKLSIAQNPDEIKKYQQERNKALMNATQAGLAIGVSALMIVGSYFAPGSVNIAAGALLGTSLALGAGRAIFGAYTAVSKKSAEEEIKSSHNTSEVEHKKEHTENLSKAFFAYLSAHLHVRRVNEFLSKTGGAVEKNIEKTIDESRANNSSSARASTGTQTGNNKTTNIKSKTVHSGLKPDDKSAANKYQPK